MTLRLEEVKDEKDFDEILPVLYAAFGEPYNSLRKWFIPVHTTVEAAVEGSKERNVRSWKQSEGIHWLKVTDTDSGKIIGAAEWEIRQQVSPPDEPQGPINAYWHTEGSEEKAFAEKLFINLKGFMKKRMGRPHIGRYRIIDNPSFANIFSIKSSNNSLCILTTAREALGNCWSIGVSRKQMNSGSKHVSSQCHLPCPFMKNMVLATLMSLNLI